MLPAGRESVISQNSILTMPSPGTKLAPERFQGDFRKVQKFRTAFREAVCGVWCHRTRGDLRSSFAVLFKERTRDNSGTSAIPEPWLARTPICDSDAIWCWFWCQVFQSPRLGNLGKEAEVKSIKNLAQMEEILQVISEGGRIVEEWW